MKKAGIWVFRSLVVVAAVGMIASWITPWWTCTIHELGKDIVKIYPYGLEQNLGEWASYTEGADMPAFFAPFMWLYFTVAIVALLVGAWIHDRDITLFGRKFDLSRWLVGLVGFTYAIALVTAVIVIAIRAKGFFNTPLQGYFTIDFSEMHSAGISSLTTGYWLAWGVGLFLIALALLRNKLVGKTKLN